MVEITIPLVLDVIRTVGILVAIIYYLTIMRNTQKNRMKEMVFQRMQSRADPEYQKMAREIEPMRHGWNTVEEFREKYNYDTTPDLVVKRASVIARLESWGYLLREGLIDEEFIDRLHVPYMIIQIWESYEPLFLLDREDFGNPEAHKDLEYLYRVVKKKYPNISADTKFSFHRARERVMERRTLESDRTQ
jgi:hypothetical protein